MVIQLLSSPISSSLNSTSNLPAGSKFLAATVLGANTIGIKRDLL